MQQLEAELRRKDAAVKARDKEIAVLKRHCKELQHRVHCTCPFETEPSPPCLEAVKLADDRPDQLEAEMELRTPRTLPGLARGDIDGLQWKVVRETTRDEKYLSGYSRLLSPPFTGCRFAWSDLQEELVPVAQGSKADEVDMKVRDYFARFPDFRLLCLQLKPGSYYLGEPVRQVVSVQLTPGGKAVLKVCGKSRSLYSFLDEVRGAARAASSLSPRRSLASAHRSVSPRSSLASAHRSEDSRRSSSPCRAGASLRACSRTEKYRSQGTKEQTSMVV